MIKIAVLLLSSLVIYFGSVFISGDNEIYIEQSFPKTISAGSEFTVSLTVHKGALTGFARLQQFLPKGFSAEATETKRAQFINDESSAKFIWITIPVEDVFTISYKIKVDSSVSGLQAINGLFYYIQNEKTQKVSLDPIEINVGSLETVDQNKLKVDRKLISIDPSKGEFRVELTFESNAEKTSAQFIDEIPAGFVAEPIDSHGATFNFKENKASFEWTTFPTESSFSIAYKVSSVNIKSAPQINGMLIYGNEENKSEEDRTKDIAGEENIPDSIIDALISDENDKQIMASKIIEESKKNISTAQDVSVNLLSSQSGIYYKVQICATRKSPPRNNDFFTNLYHLPERIELTEHEGWKKYIIGAFTNYREARQFNKRTREKVSDAFIVAYDNGERIGLKEANTRKKLNQ